MIPTWGKTGGGATLALDFVNAQNLPASVTFSRGTAATQYGSNGALIWSPMNAIRNNTMVGAVAGTPGTAPTNWSTFTALTGLTQTIVGTGVQSGISYIDIRLSGTPSAAGVFSILDEANNGVAALTGQTWTHSVFLSLAAGTTTGISAVTTVFEERTSANVFISEQNSTAYSVSAGALTAARQSKTATTNGGATTAFLNAYFRLTLTGVAIDITLRIGMPQLELGSAATAVNATSGTAYYGPRFDYDPASLVYQNLLTYSEQFDNAAWARSGSSVTADAAGAPDGNTTAEKLVEDLSNGVHSLNRTAASVGIAQTFSVYAKSAGRTEIALQLGSGAVFFNLSAGTASGTGASIQNVGNGWYRCIYAATPGNANSLIFLAVAGSASYQGDGTSGVYIWGAQLNTGSTALPYYATTSAAYTQCAPNGLLIEEQRTNSIRNNTMQGAVAGTPGTAPTNWTVALNGITGVTTSIVGTGVQNGIAYIDIRANGTPSATIAQGVQIAFEPGTTIAASASQVWTQSAWVSVVAGSTANISGFVHNVQQYNAGAFVQSNSVAFTPTSTLSRYAGTVTFSASTTTAALPLIGIGVTSGQAIDITLRIGLPQLELGAFATSVIPTYGAAATRNADTASMTGTNFSSWYNATQGTLYSEAVFSAPNAAVQQFAAQIALSSSEYFGLFKDTSPTNMTARARSGGVDQAYLYTTSPLSAGVIYKTAFAVQANDFAACSNGGTVQTDTAGTVPAGLTSMGIGGATYTQSVQLNGWVRSIRYYPTRLPNATLQGLTV